MYKLLKDQSGVIKVVPILLIIAAIGIISFLLLSSTGPFQGLFSRLFPKPFSHAALLQDDGFESGDISKWDSSDVEGLNVLEVKNFSAMNGSFGLHSKTVGSNDTARVIKNITPPTPEMYSRVWLKLNTPVATSDAIQRFMTASDNGLGIFSAKTGKNTIYLWKGNSSKDKNTQTNLDLQLDSWYCVETHVVAGTTDGRLEAWVTDASGSALLHEDQPDSDTGVSISDLALGAHGGPGGSDFYYDDFAANDTNKIGCGTPPGRQGPIRSNTTLTPPVDASGLLPGGTTQVTMRLDTSVPATCKYIKDTVGTSYSAMPNRFSSDSSPQTTHSRLITGISPGNNYTYYVRCDGGSAGVNDDDYRITFRSGKVDTTTKPLELAATYQSISVYAPFSQDENGNNYATFSWSDDGGQSWKAGMEMTVDRRVLVFNHINPFNNQFRASVLGLKPNTNYQIRVTFTDPDGVTGALQQTASITTRNDNFASPGNQFIVDASTASDPPAGDCSHTFRTITAAIQCIQPNRGDVVLVKAGTYKEAIVIPPEHSGYPSTYPNTPGDPGHYTTIKNFGSDKPEIDASLSPATCMTGDRRCGVIIKGSFVNFSGFDIVNAEIGVLVESPCQPDCTAVTEYDVIQNNHIYNMAAVPLEYLNEDDITGTENSNIIVGKGFNPQNGVRNITVQNNVLDTAKRDRAKGAINTVSTYGGHVYRNNQINFHHEYTLALNGRKVHGNDCMNGTPNFPQPNDPGIIEYPQPPYTHGIISHLIDRNNPPKGHEGGYFKDTDIYNNVCHDANDDSFEIDGANMNIRIWGNVSTGSQSGFSITPVFYGPVYVFRNVYYNFRSHWSTDCHAVKSGEGGTGSVYFYHNTFYYGFEGDPVKAMQCNRDGDIQYINVDNDGGSGYTGTTVTLSGGGGNNAAATAIAQNGVITNIVLDKAGTGYTSAPTVTIIGAGSGATATATVSGGKVTGISVTNGGSGYLSVNISGNIGTDVCTQSVANGFGNPCHPALAAPIVDNGKILSIVLKDTGFGYTTYPTVTITNGGGSRAQASARMGSAGVAFSGGSPPDAENVYYKNNIMQAYSRLTSLFRLNSKPIMDYNLMWDETPEYDGFAKYTNDVYPSYADFKAGARDQFGHTLEDHGLNAKANFVNLANWDLRLAPGSPGINQGVRLVGFNDENSAWPATGTAPDMGAFESGSGSTPPPSSSPTPTATPTPTRTPTPTPTPTPASIPGDTDGDGDVDIFDYNQLVADFGRTGANLKGDVDHDGDVDIFDHNIIVTHFGEHR